MHWLRWRRHGDPLYDAPVGGWPKHGYSRRAKRSLEYNFWLNMKSRCLNPNDPHYANYGGRGIKICQAWMDSFKAFLSDVGFRPSPNTSLDRIDTNGNYELGNVRWASRSEQQRNRRVNVKIPFDGQEYFLDDLAKLHKLSPDTLRGRLIAGWDLRTAVTTPPQRGRRGPQGEKRKEVDYVQQ